MKKTKDKTKKNKAGKKATLLGGAAKSIKGLRKRKLSTTQKVLGGAALLALGVGYLAKRLGGTDLPARPDATTTADIAGAESNLAAMEVDA
ncbi:hypothetical protein MON38_04915 [Hymenobacter sp. DH14]|uniref:Uncharacterized protein n=1 Tax=Hymenobacter cyanobacteriorum TaxID=2926463 RepID=A0A9X1VCR0_9BACT|nr:hypothetical protein [Hymenobacter cyanobacteriorum]MCI1186749.1 hypothetical protein [Hymenobacter cyanobacteriorum]